MGLIKCCVPQCSDKSSPRHRFPNPKKYLERFKLWLKLVGNKDLLEMDPFNLYNLKRICHRHFENTDYSPGSKRLHLNALPRLFLPGKNSPISVIIEAAPMSIVMTNEAESDSSHSDENHILHINIDSRNGETEEWCRSLATTSSIDPLNDQTLEQEKEELKRWLCTVVDSIQSDSQFDAVKKFLAAIEPLKAVVLNKEDRKINR